MLLLAPSCLSLENFYTLSSRMMILKFDHISESHGGNTVPEPTFRVADLKKLGECLRIYIPRYLLGNVDAIGPSDHT